jgi:drug/metabolite transporter (DMT)-like permease
VTSPAQAASPPRPSSEGTGNERRGALLILAAALLWSTGGLGIKAISDPPLKVAFYRSAVAALILALVLRPRLFKRSPAFLAAIASYSACLVTFVVATKWTSAANAIFLQYSGVAWVMLASPVVLQEPLTRRDAAAVACAFGGMALFFVGKFRSGGCGDLVALLSGVFFAGLIMLLRSERGLAAEAAVTWGNVLTAAVLLPFVAADLSLAPRSAVVLGLLGSVQLAGAYVLFVKGIRHVTATRASLIGMAEPIANPVWVYVFLGERPSVYAVLGGAVVLSAIAWRTLSSPPATVVAPPD